MSGRLRAASLLLENPREECKNEQTRNSKHKSSAQAAKLRVAQVIKYMERGEWTCLQVDLRER